MKIRHDGGKVLEGQQEVAPEDDEDEVQFKAPPIDEDDIETEIVAITDVSTGEQLHFEIDGAHDYDHNHEQHEGMHSEQVKNLISGLGKTNDLLSDQSAKFELHRNEVKIHREVSNGRHTILIDSISENIDALSAIKDKEQDSSYIIYLIGGFILGALIASIIVAILKKRTI